MRLISGARVDECTSLQAALLFKAKVDKRGIGERLLIHIGACHKISSPLVYRGMRTREARPPTVDASFPLILDSVATEIFWRGCTHSCLAAATSTISVETTEAPNSTASTGTSAVHVTLRAI